VSTAEQNADLQIDELTAAGCYRVHTDSASGALDVSGVDLPLERPGTRSFDGTSSSLPPGLHAPDEVNHHATMRLGSRRT
jgi:hypothetical protein